MKNLTDYPITERFAYLIDGLLAFVWGRLHNPLGGLLLVAVHQRIRRIANRFARLAALIQAGKTPKIRIRAPSAASIATAPRAPSTQPKFPRARGWMLRMGKHEAAMFTNTLQELFIEPEMRALIAAHPAMARMLRPLCHMLGMDVLPPELIRPRPRRPAKAIRPPTPRAKPLPSPGRAAFVSKTKKIA